MPEAPSTEVDLTVVPGRPSVRVVLAGLAPVYRHGLALALSAEGMTCASVSSPAELTGLLGDPGSMVVVVPAASAPMLRVVTRDVPETTLAAVHVVPAATTSAYADALRGGATGVVADDAELPDVVAVVQAAATGRSLMPREVVRALCRPQTAPAPDLRPREREWLRRLADSATVASLARTSGYSEREMYRLLAGLYARLGASSRTEALLLAERWGLLDEPR